MTSQDKLKDFKFVEMPFTKDNKYNKQRNSYSIDSNNFIESDNSEGSNKLKTTPYLLIGFDTEYQTPDTLIKYRENEDNLDLDEEVLLRFE